MKLFATTVLAASLFTGFVGVTGCETTHTEKDTPGLLGGNTHESTTTTHNDVTGDTNVSKSTVKTN